MARLEPSTTSSAPAPKVAVLPPVPPPVSPASRESTRAAAEAASAAAAAAEARTGMTRAVDAYVDAIGARSVDDLRRAFPSMSDAVRRGWESLFAATRRIDARASDVQLSPASGDAGSASFTLTVDFENPVSHRPCRQVTQLRAALARSGATWRVSALDQLGNTSSAGCRR